MKGGAGVGHLLALARRLAARVIDSAVFAVVPALLELVFLRLIVAKESTPDLNRSFALGLAAGFYKILIVPFLLVVASFAYEAVIPARTGQTLGKRWLGVRVVKGGRGWMSVQPQGASFGQLTVRWLVLHVPAVVLLVLGWLEYPAGDRLLMLYGAVCFVAVGLPAAMTRSRRGVHDWVAGTVVVEVPTGRERLGRRGPGDEGFDRWQGFMRGGRFASGSGS